MSLESGAGVLQCLGARAGAVCSAMLCACTAALTFHAVAMGDSGGHVDWRAYLPANGGGCSSQVSVSCVRRARAADALRRRIAPDALVAVDGVCSVGGEELRMTEWGCAAGCVCRCADLTCAHWLPCSVDVVFTGAQKALGGPCGLCISMLLPRALVC